MRGWLPTALQQAQAYIESAANVCADYIRVGRRSKYTPPRDARGPGLWDRSPSTNRPGSRGGRCPLRRSGSGCPAVSTPS